MNNTVTNIGKGVVIPDKPEPGLKHHRKAPYCPVLEPNFFRGDQPETPGASSKKPTKAQDYEALLPTVDEELQREYEARGFPKDSVRFLRDRRDAFCVRSPVKIRIPGPPPASQVNSVNVQRDQPGQTRVEEEEAGVALREKETSETETPIPPKRTKKATKRRNAICGLQTSAMPPPPQHSPPPIPAQAMPEPHGPKKTKPDDRVLEGKYRDSVSLHHSRLRTSEYKQHRGFGIFRNSSNARQQGNRTKKSTSG